jgi:hypothetical protein
LQPHILKYLNVNPLSVVQLRETCRANSEIMASSSGVVGGGLKALKDQLYDACADLVLDQDVKVIKQQDIEEFNIEGLADINTVLQVVQTLIDEKLFKVVHDDGSIAWKLRSQEEAKRYVYSLTPQGLG